MKHIHELQNTRGKELSGIQITAYFLRIRVQPLQARKNPLWMYAGDKDVDRLSKDLSVKDLEKLVRKISSPSKKDAIPTYCRVEPYSGTNALPKKHKIVSSLPPLPEGGEVEERTVVTDDAQVTSLPESEVAGSHKSAASSEREAESEASESTHSIPSAVSPRNKRKRGDAEGSGTYKLSSSPAEETAPEETAPEEEEPFNAYDAALVSSGDEEEEPAVNVTAPMSTSQTLALSETHQALVTANKRADDLAVKLEKSEEARKKAEKDAASIEDLRKRHHKAENALSDKITQQIAREENVIARLESQNRRFVRKMSQDFELQKPEDDRLLDALSLLEIHGDLVRRSIFDAQAAFSRLFPYFFPKKEQPGTFAALTKCFVPEEDLGLALRQENLKIGVEGTIALVAESQQSVDWAKAGETTKLKTEKWQALIRAAKPHSKKILSFLGYKPAPSSSSAKPELVFDNYTATPRPSDALPASSYSKKASVDDFTEDSSNASLSQELNDLRQQLQSMKKQTIMIMDRFRKSSEREKVALQEAKEALALRDTAVAEAAQAVAREEYMLNLLTDASLDMAGSFLDSAAEDQRVETRFQDRAGQVRQYLEFCTKTLAMVYNSMFPRNVQPKTLPELMNKFKNSQQIHGFVKAQLIAGARFALIMLQICHSKLEMTKVVETVHAKLKKRRRFVDKINDRVTPVAEEMIDDLLRMDADFFMEGHYADFMGASADEDRVNIDDLIGRD
ncbi:hypothetical protein QYE76_023116 [Lolium multiflorum]|uniref:Uncharacterized protein n=1 Tax=Lolium multiflorum TaxID=4521 RepID=A0AAD8VSH5_LOLMU|nr:hypothetical protein QYE76_023116 [Lolium multiflorum]